MNSHETLGIMLAQGPILSQTTIHHTAERVADVTAYPEHIQKLLHFRRALSPEFQKNIFYFQKNGNWYAKLGDMTIGLENEKGSIVDMHAGIFVSENETYFSPEGAAKRALEANKKIPSVDDWKKMAEMVGGFRPLRELLQIPYTGFVSHGEVKRYNPHSGVHACLHTSDPHHYDYFIGLPYTVKDSPIKRGVHFDGKLVPQKFITTTIDSGIYHEYKLHKIYWNALRLLEGD